MIWIPRLKSWYRNSVAVHDESQPYPMGLNVGLINKYYDLALAGDEMAKGHYEKLPVHADTCVRCGHVIKDLHSPPKPGIII